MDRSRATEMVLTAVFLTALSLIHSTIRPVGFVLLIGIYAAILLLFVHRSPALRLKPIYGILFLAVAVLMTAHSVRTMNLLDSTRVIILLTFTAATLFVMPRVIDIEVFLQTLSRFAAVVIIVGFLPYFGVQSVAGVDLALWQAQLYWLPSQKPITSVFVTPNYLGLLAFAAVLASIAELLSKNRRALPAALLVINAVGLSLTNHRASWIALIVALALLVAFQVGGRRVLVSSVVTGLVVTCVGLTAVMIEIPGLESLFGNSLGGRRERWLVGFDLVSESPLVGHGFEVTAEATNLHNSFLRMFAAFGIVGGGLYLVFVLHAAINAARVVVSGTELVLATLLVGTIFVQLFNNSTFIGLSLHSCLISLLIGYHVIG